MPKIKPVMAWACQDPFTNKIEENMDDALMLSSLAVYRTKKDAQRSGGADLARVVRVRISVVPPKKKGRKK